MLKEKLDSRKCFATAWGKLITEEEAYRQLNRQIAAVTANLFQVMRIFEPSWENGTEAICSIANMMNMAVAGTPEQQKDHVNASLYEAFNIPELCEKSSWLGGITGDSGDEWENMAGGSFSLPGIGWRRSWTPALGHCRQRALQHDHQHVHRQLRPGFFPWHRQ